MSARFGSLERSENRNIYISIHLSFIFLSSYHFIIIVIKIKIIVYVYIINLINYLLSELFSKSSKKYLMLENKLK